MDHAGQLHIHGPGQRPVHLGGYVIALRRLADDAQFVDRLDLGLTSRGVYIFAGQRDIEAFAANKLGVSDRPCRIGPDGNRRVFYLKLCGRHPEMLSGQLQQDPSGFGRNPSHRPAIALDGVRTAGAALVRRGVGASHDQAGLAIGDIEFIAHHLPERGARALAAIGLADKKRRAVVGMDDDPSVELPEVGVGIRAFGLCERIAARTDALSLRPRRRTI
jgi:hypothetical protein